MRRAFFRFATALFAVGLAACSADLSDATQLPNELGNEDATKLFQSSDEDSQTIPLDANGLYYASITANGTGCPRNTWNVRISEDRLVFTMTFNNLIASVDSQLSVSIKDCQLSIGLHSPAGRSFSVRSFSYSGYANLQSGVIGRQTAQYYFQGTAALPRQQSRTELIGPYDDDYLFEDDIPVESRVWSPCGLVRDLHVVTRLHLRHGESPGSGVMNLAAVDGNIGNVQLALDQRSCTSEVEQVDAGAPNKGMPDASASSAGSRDAGTSDGGAPQSSDPWLPAGNVDQPINVHVNPRVVEAAQRFLVNWSPITTESATYKLRVHRHADDGFGLIWESPSVADSPLIYNGPTLSPGRYQAVIVARMRASEVSSERVSFEARDSNAKPSSTTSSDGKSSSTKSEGKASSTKPEGKASSAKPDGKSASKTPDGKSASTKSSDKKPSQSK